MKKAAFMPVAAALMLALSSCQTAPPVSEVPELAFTTMPKTNLNVSRIEIVNNFHPTMAAPHIEHLFRQPPALVAQRMLENGLVANGSYNTLRVTIDDASVVRRDLPVSKGIFDLFNNEEAEEFKAHVALRFELLAEGSERVEGHATVTSDRLTTLLEDASPVDRDNAYFELDEAIRNDLQAGFDGVVRNTFGWK